MEGGLTQTAHFSFLPETTFCSHHQPYFLSFTNTPCFWIWHKTAGRFRTQCGDSHGWARRHFYWRGVSPCPQLWQHPPLGDLSLVKKWLWPASIHPCWKCPVLKSHPNSTPRLRGLQRHSLLSHFHPQKPCHPKARQE